LASADRPSLLCHREQVEELLHVLAGDEILLAQGKDRLGLAWAAASPRDIVPRNQRTGKRLGHDRLYGTIVTERQKKNPPPDQRGENDPSRMANLRSRIVVRDPKAPSKTEELSFIAYGRRGAGSFVMDLPINPLAPPL
jgi:hypothetical protein